ncbi:hypothetical protein BRC81_11405 [Halobacteriales archaeon QS_1_68_20]|nr:MAG: hypothetical protein BRC81_11405 [Halobacteriales archaeon QS_1_68_20]
MQSALPGWVLAGLALGAAFTVVAVVAFVAGTRLFPGPNHDQRGTGPGEQKRRAEIRAYLGDLGEEFVEDHPICGRPVAFYLPERDVAITFDARAFFRIENSETHAVLVEHELPGLLLGARLPFETPDPEPAVEESPSRDPVAAAFDVLDLPRDAGEDAVQSAYRERVKSAHPDHGGDPEAFERVVEAYTVARAAAAETEDPVSAPR